MLERISPENAFEQYCNAIRERKNYSNCYLTLNEVEKNLKVGILKAYNSNGAFLMINTKEKAAYLYFICSTWEWLQDVKELKKETDFLFLSIVKKGTLGEYEILRNDMEPVRIYDRLRTGTVPVFPEKEIQYRFCTQEDEKQLQMFMDITFDLAGDHIPLEDELQDFIKGKNIICIEQENGMAGFLIFEDKGKTSYVRMVCINPAIRGQGFGRKLMQVYFMIHRNFQSFTLWCRSDNERALSLYASLGYESEDIHDYIFKV